MPSRSTPEKQRTRVQVGTRGSGGWLVGRPEGGVQGAGGSLVWSSGEKAGLERKWGAAQRSGRRKPEGAAELPQGKGGESQEGRRCYRRRTLTWGREAGGKERRGEGSQRPGPGSLREEEGSVGSEVGQGSSETSTKTLCSVYDVRGAPSCLGEERVAGR